MTVTGLAEAKAKLDQLTEKQMKSSERAALRKGGQILQKRAQALAPYDNSPNRKDHTHLRDKGISLSTSVTNSKDEVNIGTNRIGRFQELGTVHNAAQPFMRPALEETQEQVISVYGQAFKDRIDKLTSGA